MNKTRFATLTVAALMSSAMFGNTIGAQAPTPSPAKPDSASAAAKPMIPLKVLIVVSRYDGEKKTASLPFTLWVNTNAGRQSLNMSTQVPIPNTVMPGPNTVPVDSSFTYKNIGTNIGCTATMLEDARFSVDVTISDSSMLPDKGTAAGKMAGIPSFQSFNVSNVVILKDGQTAQFATATDAVSGQVTKIDITVTTVK